MAFSRNIKKAIALVCLGTLAFLLYIPGGPDLCSPVFTDAQYESCLEGTFAGMPFADVR